MYLSANGYLLALNVRNQKLNYTYIYIKYWYTLYYGSTDYSLQY